MSDASQVERVARVVRQAREMSLCSLCDRPHPMIRCTCREIARAAIAAMQPAQIVQPKGLGMGCYAGFVRGKK